MNSKWDYKIPSVEYWQEVFRVLKPGAYLLSFGGARTFHRLACAIEDAGFEIRDTIMWIYSSGFPKGLNIGKATELDEWEGWNTNLKPAHEPIIMARKPLDGKIVDNVIKHGTGGINIDECRIDLQGDKTSRTLSKPTGWKCTSEQVGTINDDWQKGRYPANVIHDGNVEFPDNAARFFYCSKTSKKDRDEGLTDLPKKPYSHDDRKAHHESPYQRHNSVAANNHPTVKPNSLMRYLCKLVTPKNGTVLDPFMGSGSTGKAALQEKFNFVGIDINKEYCEIAIKRMQNL